MLHLVMCPVSTMGCVTDLSLWCHLLECLWAQLVKQLSLAFVLLWMQYHTLQVACSAGTTSLICKVTSTPLPFTL